MSAPEYGAPRDWHTVESLRGTDEHGEPVWAQAADIAESLLADLVDVARDNVLAYAPALPEDYPLGKCPAAYRLAHLMQTRNLWNAVTEDDGGGGFAGDEYAIRPVPLDWIIKQILRPKTATPVAL